MFAEAQLLCVSGPVRTILKVVLIKLSFPIRLTPNADTLCCVFLVNPWQMLPREGRKEGSVLFNDALNTFYLRLYGVRHIMVKDHSDNERGNQLLPHGLLFPINSKGSFICTIPQTG